ncbi:hypothetical protein F5Y06DRAFT_308737 [Hypoxylon sp. FL0890]|nr:hypothetical protein F5Y06DRAFT_308737 [Hypoxylon sp. FL0890]
MAIEWDMAAFLAALTIFVVPYLVKALKFIYDASRRSRRRYICLQWRDIPQGRIHQCSHVGIGYHQPCSHLGRPHQPGKECWKSAASLGSCFNRAWEISMRRPRYAKSIPDSLPVGSQFICTDASTVLAFALCTADERRSPYWHAKSLSFDRSMLTKAELERVLYGYPPWYRETFTTRANITSPFPISSESDIRRAGRIIAVGLMSCGSNRHKPLALYRCLDKPEYMKSRWRNGLTFRLAVERCRDHIQKNIAPHFPGNRDVACAIRALSHLAVWHSSSGMPRDLGLKANDIDELPHLQPPDCKFVFDNFNEYRELDHRAKAKSEPILFPVMAAAVHGAVEAIEYHRRDGMELEIPPELLPLDREVWLRDCMTKLPFKLEATPLRWHNP